VTFNSGSDQLLTPDHRKLVMGLLAPARADLYAGELAEESPMDTMFDPAMPYCSVLSTFQSSEALAATKSASITSASITRPLKLLYRAYEPHSTMIANEIIATLYQNGIMVTPMPVQTREAYNDANCEYLEGFDYDGTPSECAEGDWECLAKHHAWDIAISRSWGPPYDASSKLWDMTHNWCSAEADAPAVINMESMSKSDFNSKVRALGTFTDKAERQSKYTEILSTLHAEAIFLPVSALRQTAVANKRVSGFAFGFMEFDFPLANLYPTPPTSESDDDDSLSNAAIAGIAVAAGIAALLMVCVLALVMKEKSGTPIFTPMGDATTKKPVQDVAA